MSVRKAAVLVLLAIVTVCWWFLAAPRRTDPAAAPAPTRGDSSPPALLPPSPAPVSKLAGDTAATVRTPALPQVDGGDPVIPSVPLETGKLPWEKTIDATLDDKKASDAEKGRRLLETIPTMPVEGRETAAEKAIALIPDAAYRHASAAITNPAMFGTSVGVLYADLMNRPDEVRLPTLLAIARNPEHPYAPSARDNLNLILGKNLGNDWTGWDAAIRQHLAAKKPPG